MKKEINQLIYNLCLPYFSRLGFKIKKRSQGGIFYTFKHGSFICSGAFVFSGYMQKIDFLGRNALEIRLNEVEDIYCSVFRKNGLDVSNQVTITKVDDEWKKAFLNDESANSFYIENDDFSAIETHTRRILNRIESHVLPLVQQYLSLPYWADLYEKKKETLYEENQADLYYNYVHDRYSVKHLIILKLCGSPSFKEAYEIRLRQISKLVEQNTEKESESFKRLLTIKNIILDLKELLDATPPKYDLHDLTPPFRFEKKEVEEEAKPQIKPKVVLKGRSLEVDVNVFDITPVQKQTVDVFLENIEGHYDTVLEEIISNAEFENQDGGDFSTDCGGTLACIAEESGLIKTKPVGFEREAAEHLYPQHISIDVEHDSVVISIANNYCDLVLNAHLMLAGHVEIVAWE